MPKSHISEANEVIKHRYAAKLRAGGNVTGQGGRYICHSPALAWREGALFAWASGFDVDPPLTPATAELDRLVAEGSPLTNEFRRTHVIELHEERRAQTAWHAMRRWAGEPSEAERAKAAHLEREKTAREEAIATRAGELLAAEETKRVEAARKRARAEAEKELAQ
jgi:hypothetical protein